MKSLQLTKKIFDIELAHTKNPIREDHSKPTK